VVERVAPAFAAVVEERAVGSDPALEAYRREIPVLLLGAREVARHRISEADLRERLIGLGLMPSAR
jgi:hypothetical protein